VIKIEPPGEGDPTRHLGPSDGGSTVYFRNLNRGKKSVVLDLKNPQEREALLRLAETADVFVESFRPGVVERLGVGYEQLRARNPRIVYCSISAFDRDGPYRDRPAHDLAVEALSGVLSMTLGEDGKPTIPGLPLADLLTALNGLAGILMALLARQRTGKGDYVEIAMHDAMLAGCANILGPTFAENRQPAPRHERTTGGSAFYRLYETADGRHLALGGQEMKFVRNLLGALGKPELGALCERPGAHQQPVMDLLAEVFRSKTLEQNLAFLAPLDVCYAPVNTLPEALDAAREMLLKDESGRRHLAPPIRFRDEPARPKLREPRLGEHDALKKP
jgi:crotonobetainyl-CoA:carnitine CoA-transferase CaiB-like acyl-CoA transferase